MPALYCLDELILRIQFDSDVALSSGVYVTITAGSIEASIIIGDVTDFSGVTYLGDDAILVLRARTQPLADDYVRPPGSLPSWRVDAWLEPAGI